MRYINPFDLTNITGISKVNIIFYFVGIIKSFSYEMEISSEGIGCVAGCRVALSILDAAALDRLTSRLFDSLPATRITRKSWNENCASNTVYLEGIRRVRRFHSPDVKICWE